MMFWFYCFPESLYQNPEFGKGDFHRKGNNKIDVTLKFQKQFTTFFPVLGFHIC